MPVIATAPAENIADPVCTLDAEGYCARHQEKHFGRRLTLSQDQSERGAAARRTWDGLLRGDLWAAVPAPPPAAIMSGAVTSIAGVGYELKGLFDEKGILDTGCGQCAALRADMDALGPEGCRKDIARLAGLLNSNAKHFGWIAWLATHAKLGLAGYTSCESLIEEACRRAEAKAAQQPPAPVIASV